VSLTSLVRSMSASMKRLMRIGSTKGIKTGSRVTKDFGPFKCDGTVVWHNRKLAAIQWDGMDTVDSYPYQLNELELINDKRTPRAD